MAEAFVKAFKRGDVRFGSILNIAPGIDSPGMIDRDLCPI
jgi:hypothetical protein